MPGYVSLTYATLSVAFTTSVTVMVQVTLHISTL